MDGEQRTPDPKLAILQTIQHNMMSDAILQTLGYVLLGTAIRSAPDLNDKAHYADVDFSEDKDIDVSKFEVGSASAGDLNPAKLLTEFDTITKMLAEKVRSILIDHKIVLGSMRINITFRVPEVEESGMIDTPLRIVLMWIEERK